MYIEYGGNGHIKDGFSSVIVIKVRHKFGALLISPRPNLYQHQRSCTKATEKGRRQQLKEPRDHELS